MKISLITVFPQLHDAFFKTSLIARAQEKGLLEVALLSFSDFCAPKERIDEPLCGPGVGMILKPQVIERAITAAQERWGKGFIIFFSPQGQKLDQPLLHELKFCLEEKKEISPEKSFVQPHLILVCARYEGIDDRVISHYADCVISIGDYVLMGGDVPAQVFLEGLLRLLPGILGNEQSLEKESFESAFLEHPQYGLPVEWKGMTVPEVMRSGNHGAIDEWQKKAAAVKTLYHRFDWLSSSDLSDQERALVKRCIPKHYVALMHNEVVVKGKGEGVTSVTSLDLHDSARSAATYGVEKVFIVTSLEDQRSIMDTFLDFWSSPQGLRYNPSRFEAVKRLVQAENLDEVIERITEQEGHKPLIIATSAQAYDGCEVIDYASQGQVWQKDRAVLFLFGTGQGLHETALKKCDYILLPIKGLSDYNHLSVRSAIAIILDRWLGLKKRLRTRGKMLDKWAKSRYSD